MAHTPMLSGVEAYLARQTARFHMPGHRGRLPAPLAQAAPYDITEVAGVDSLYESAGIIRQTEDAYRDLYGTDASFLSVGGSTLCIQAMLALALNPHTQTNKILCGRGVHTAAVNAMALLGWQPVWVYPTQAVDGLMGAIEPQTVAQALAQNPDVGAVYITSPNYYGVLCDVAGIAAVCRQYQIPLLVDNAHGAHLKFLPQSLHPMDLGADLCADSLHKTLPVLTGGALLHSSRADFSAEAKRKMALFGSTSPSYLIMLSADMALPYLQKQIRADVAQVGAHIAQLSQLAAEKGFALPQGQLDPMRLAVGFRPLGFTGQAFGAYIRAKGIEPEYLGDNYCVFLAGPTTRDEDWARLEQVLSQVPSQAPPTGEAAPITVTPPEAVMGLREALLAPSRLLPVEKAAGHIASGICAPCPPGIPVVVPGEKIAGNMVRLLKNYGISCINVVE